MYTLTFGVPRWPQVGPRPQNWLKMGPQIDLLPKASKKGAKSIPKEGSQTELNPGPRKKKQEQISLTQYLLCLSHVGRSKKDNFLC